jgi:tetratricopeptide (TPR) repeat protein
VIHLLDGGTGRPTGVALRHADPVETLLSSADGRVAVTSVRSGPEEGGYEVVWDGFSTIRPIHHVDARVWDASSGELLAPPLRHRRGFDNFPRTLPDGSRVLTCPGPWELRLTDLAPDQRPAEVLTRVAEGLSGRRLTEAGAFVALDRAAHRAAWDELPALLPPAPDPEYRPAGWHRGRARDAAEVGDRETARFHYDRLVALAPDDAAAHRALAGTALEQGDGAAAAAAAARATELAPGDASGWLLRANADRNRGRWKEAGDHARRATQCVRPDEPPDEQDAWRYYLVARALAGDPAAYRQACAELLGTYAAREHPRLVLRWATLRPGGVDDVAALIRRAREAGAKEPAENAKFDLSVLAQAHLRAGEYAEALARLDELDRRFPATLGGWDRLVRALALHHLGRAAEARAELQRARDWAGRFIYGTEPDPATSRPVPYPVKLVYVALAPEAEGLITKEGPAPAAVEAARQAVASAQKRVAAAPGEPGPRAQLALGLDDLGDLLRAAGKKAEAEEPYRKALAVRQELAADFPDGPGHAAALGRAYNRFGDRAADGGDPEAALGWYAKAAGAVGPAREKAPGDADVRKGLRQAHWRRAQALARLGRHAEAVGEYGRALEASAEPVERADVLAFRAVSRVRAGQLQEGLRDADELARGGGATSLYNAACVYATASGDKAGAGHEEEYALRAVGLLGEAVAKGYRDPAQMVADSDLDAVCDRPDFRAVLTDLGAKAPDPYPAALDALGRKLVARGRPGAAEPLLRDALTLCEKADPDAWVTADTRLSLGEALLGQTKYAEAEPLLRDAYEAMKRHEADLPLSALPRLAEALDRLVRLYDAWGKTPEANRWRGVQEQRSAGYVRDWLVLSEPIPYDDADGAKALDREQLPGEAALRPRAGDAAEAGGLRLAWKPHRAPHRVLDFVALYGRPADRRVAYAVCYVEAEADRDGLVLRVGSDDQARVYLNGREVHHCARPRPFRLDEDEVKPVRLQKGVNVLVFKVVNEALDWAGSLRLTDGGGRAPEGVRFRTAP